MDAAEGIQFRRAGVADAERVTEFGRRSFEAAFGPKNKPEDMHDYLEKSFSLAQIKTELEDPISFFLLAFQDGILIAYSKLILNKGHACVKGEAPVELQRIYVEPQAIGQGIGSQILEASIQEARRVGQKTIWLGVWDENTKAIRFYERQGFSKICEQDFMLGRDPQIDWVMQRTL